LNLRDKMAIEAIQEPFMSPQSHLSFLRVLISQIRR
jgi:hypothetical protein